MKKTKVLLGAIALGFFVSCGQSKTDETSSRKMALAACVGNVNRTLNNISESDALKMIALFKSKVYKRESLAKLNFWFDISVVRDILTLIKNEASAGKKVDGLRIYFASDLATPTNVSLILVTTTDSTGLDEAGHMGTLHRDYFQHACSENIFNNSLSAGTLFKPGQSTGARLYQISGETVGDQTCNIPGNLHYLKRADAEEMVRGFGNGVMNSRAEWFPTSVLQEIENDARAGGMRVYFATNTVTNAHFKNRDTFVLAATRKGSENYEDILDCTAMAIIKKPLPPPLNNGELCPDNCDH